MIKKLLRKARSEKGFSMGEMLVATLILALMTSALAAGISSSLRVYRDSVTYSEKRMLLSTLAESLTTELRYAREADFDIVDAGNGKYKLHNYTSINFGFDSIIKVDTNGIIAVKGTDLVGNGVYSTNQKLNADLVATDGSGNVTTSSTKGANAEVYYYNENCPDPMKKNCFEFTVAVYSGSEQTPETRTILVKPMETPDTSNLYKETAT